MRQRAMAIAIWGPGEWLHCAVSGAEEIGAQSRRLLRPEWGERSGVFRVAVRKAQMGSDNTKSGTESLRVPHHGSRQRQQPAAGHRRRNSQAPQSGSCAAAAMTSILAPGRFLISPLKTKPNNLALRSVDFSNARRRARLPQYSAAACPPACPCSIRRPPKVPRPPTGR
ncbi:hypothetical protein BU26DRAFT_137841 [Trematosphaeria pertusa]|uniref:Uncharacterized protein n=1 Tax=Trematosphaeria pertusa TaxID=390896 RepID=A0A6A6IZ24_9PLEO|nr:uncharacterized protein BU26DRAFT_137841 [Trematosphaeria pertusa]KAF2254433.1 hypothetical protein BU26DRAFT_137841 [Trematosphaeria pertusa]